MMGPIIALALAALIWATDWAGAVVAGAWIGTGIGMVAATERRGLLADATFVFTWPVHWIMER